MLANINPVTHIPYGVISANSLHPDVVANLVTHGRDVRWDNACDEISEIARSAFSDYVRSSRMDNLIEHVVELAAEDWDCEEPIYEGEWENVKFRTGWLGGAMLVWVMESPFTGEYATCSPCVPNAGDLNNDGSYFCYDVPKDWRAE